MGFFKNATVFEYSEDGAAVRPADLEFAAASLRSRPPEKHESCTMGFVPALWPGALELIHVSDRYAMAAVRIEQKRVPPSLEREETARKCSEFVKREGREPSRDEVSGLRAAAHADLLGRAFPRVRKVNVLFAPDLVVVGTASKNDVDDVCGLIRQSLGSLPIRPVRETSTTRTVLTHWVAHGAPRDDNGIGFHLGEAATLKGRAMKGEGAPPVVAIRNAELRSAEVRGHLETRKDVLRLAFAWKRSDDVVIRGTISDDFVLRSLKTEGSTADTGDADDVASIYAAEFFAEAAALTELIAALRKEVMPGEGQRPAGSGGRVAGEREVRVAAGLYEAREEVRHLLGDLYKSKMAEFGEVLTKKQAESGKDLLIVALDVANSQPSAVLSRMVLAAAVELIEPTVEGQPS